MRKLLFVAAACLIAAPVAAGELRGAQSTELSSQGVYVGVPGVGVRVGPDRDRHDGRRDRRWRDREVRGGGCKHRDGARDAAGRHAGHADAFALLI